MTKKQITSPICSVHLYPPLLTEVSLYPEEGQITVALHVGDFQILQDHSAVAIGLHHVQVVVFFGSQKV